MKLSTPSYDRPLPQDRHGYRRVLPWAVLAGLVIGIGLTLAVQRLTPTPALDRGPITTVQPNG